MLVWGALPPPTEEHDYSEHRNLRGQKPPAPVQGWEGWGSFFLLLPEGETAQEGVNLAKAISGQSKE